MVKQEQENRAIIVATGPGFVKQSKNWSLERRRRRYFYWLISPWVFGFLVFTLGPMVYSFYISLTRWNLLNKATFIGLQNYQQMMQDPMFWQSLKVTSIYSVASVPLGLVFGLFLALLLNQQVKGLSFFRTALYLPSVVSGVSVSVVFLWIFNPQFGLLNSILGYFGIRGPDWIGDPHWALSSLILMSLWNVGGTMIIFLAGLQGIPIELYESSAIDGATSWRSFWSITIPMLTPTILFNLVMQIIGQFQTFTQAFVMTNGGPENSTLFYVFYLYQNAFNFLNMGYAAALAWVLFVIVLVLTLIVMITSNKWVFYGGSDK